MSRIGEYPADEDLSAGAPGSGSEEAGVGEEVVSPLAVIGSSSPKMWLEKHLHERLGDLASMQMHR
jgi:hypothetical protein